MRKYAPQIKKSDNFQTTRRKELILHIHIVFYTLRMCVGLITPTWGLRQANKTM